MLTCVDNSSQHGVNKKMKLREWLYRARITIKDFSTSLEIDRSYLHMLMRGDRIPSDELMIKITQATSGKVKKITDILDKKGET